MMLLQLNVIPTDYRVRVPKPRTKQMCANVSVAFLPVVAVEQTLALACVTISFSGCFQTP